MLSTGRLGRLAMDLTIPTDRVIRLQGVGLKQITSGAAALVGAALARPEGFPSLRQALTPDDHVAIAVGPGLSDRDAFLRPLLDELAAAGVASDHVGLVVHPEAKVEESTLARHPHVPDDRGGLSYLASTKAGRRIYLNRTIVEADQAVVIAEVRFDARGEVSGGATALFPALSDAATVAALGGEPLTKLQTEAEEVAWLLGAPFFLHVVRGPGGGIAHVFGGLADSFAVARAACETVWRAEIAEPADVVVANVGGNDLEPTVDDFAAALANGSRIARPGGTLVLVSDAAPAMGAGWEAIRHADSIADARKALRQVPVLERSSPGVWLRAADEYRVLVLSGWPGLLVEQLFAAPVENLVQLQRVVDAGGRVAFVPDAERMQVFVQHE